MKWERIKEVVAREAWTRIRDGWDFELDAGILSDLAKSDFAAKRGRTHEQMVEAYADAVWNRIMAWDLRAAGRLRALFPTWFPGSLRTGDLLIDMDADADWCIVRA